MEEVFEEAENMKYDAKNLKNCFNHFIDIRELKEGSIMVDAGACRAEFMDALEECNVMIDKMRIIMIEPSRWNAEKLRRFRNSEIHEKALVGMDYDDSVTFTQPLWKKARGNIFGTTLRNRSEVVGIDEYIVETIKINNIFDELGVDEIDYMKMDTEGAEKNILETMSLETASKIGQLSVEVHPQYDITIAWVKNKLKDLGYDWIEKFSRYNEVYCKRRN